MDQDGQDQNQASAAPPPQEAPPQSNDAAPEQSSAPQSTEPVGDASSPQDGEEAAAVSPPPAETEATAEESPAAEPAMKQRDESPPAESTTAPAAGGDKEAPQSEEPRTGKPPAAEEGARGTIARDEDIAWGLLAQAERRDRGDLDRTAHNDAAAKRKAAAKAHQAAESEFAQGLAEVEREAAKERRAKDKAVREAAREREKENRALYTARLVVERKRAETLRQLHRDTAVKRADEVDAVKKEEVRKAREARAANFSTRVKNNDASRQHATPDPKRTTGVSPVRGAATPAPVFSPSRRIVDEAVEEAARRQAERENRAIIEARERRNRELVRAEQREREAAQRREEEALRAAAAARAAEAMHQMSEQQKAEAARLDHLVRENRRRRELSPLKDDPSPVKPPMSPREEVDNTMASVNRVVEERLANRRREQERRKAEIAARDRQLLADIESAKKLEAVELATDREHVNTLRAADERRRARLRQWREERTTAANEAVSQLKKQCAQDAAGAVEDTTQARRERLLETERLHQVHLLTKQQAAAAKAADLLRQEELAAERRAARLAAQRESEAAAAAAREEAERLRLKRVANQQRFTEDRKLSGQEKELRTEAFYKGFAPPPKAPTVRAPKKFSESEARRSAVAPYNEVAAIAPGGSVYDSKVDADLAAADRSLKQIRKEARK